MERPRWARWLGLESEPKPKVVKIPVRQLGLATGRVIVVRVAKRK